MPVTWKGSLTFGLVHVPVEMIPAVTESRVPFRLLHAADATPIRLARVRADDARPVPWREIARGYEIEPGRFVVLDEDDFARAAASRSRVLALDVFVPAHAIDPRYVEAPYVLLPSEEGARAYAVLREAMRARDVVGIGTMILRRRERLVGIHVLDDALVAILLRFPEELVPLRELALPAAHDARAAEVRLAEELVAVRSSRFEPERYPDRYRAELMRRIAAKAEGRHPDEEPAVEEAEEARVLDLMERLEESLRRERARRAPQADAPRDRHADRRRRSPRRSA
jgi:DNA end-binding protein Ku